MRIVVCVKKVLDPDAVNNYALAGNLNIGADGKTLEVSAIPQLMNAFDEQAMEAALRLRDAGADCRITAVSIGPDTKTLLKQCAALGADEIVAIDAEPAALDSQVTANILSAYIRSSGGADLILCGRQASDDDQGVVPALIGESLGLPVVPLARAIEVSGTSLTVIRATPDGDEIVAGVTPAVVTISNELGDPRFPTAKAKMAARKMPLVSISIADLDLTGDQLTPRIILKKQYVPEVHGSCEFIDGTPAEAARILVEKLRSDGTIQ